MPCRCSYNIWHTWNEGLMGIFQTLREHGDLPLVNIDEDGNMDEITQGMGGGCPWEYDFGLQKAVQPQHCGKRSGTACQLSRLHLSYWPAANHFESKCT